LNSSVLGVVSLLAQELQRLNGRGHAEAVSPLASYHHPTAQPASLSPASNGTWRRNAMDPYVISETVRGDHPRKRRRVDSCGNPNIEVAVPLEDLDSPAASLPPPEVMEEVISVYFQVIQPWIPILHETQFRRRIHDPTDLPLLVVVLHAMVVATLRFVNLKGQTLSEADLTAQTTRSRSIVLLTALDRLSVENLQGLVIIAFNDVSTRPGPGSSFPDFPFY
jgi:hypothetical protein